MSSARKPSGKAGAKAPATARNSYMVTITDTTHWTITLNALDATNAEQQAWLLFQLDREDSFADDSEISITTMEVRS